MPKIFIMALREYKNPPTTVKSEIIQKKYPQTYENLKKLRRKSLKWDPGIRTASIYSNETAIISQNNNNNKFRTCDGTAQPCAFRYKFYISI